MIQLAARIVLRVLIGMFVMWAWLTPEVGEQFVSDPDLVMAIETALGAAFWAGIEAWTVIARRLGWAT